MITPTEIVTYVQKAFELAERATSALERIADLLDSWNSLDGDSLDVRIGGVVETHNE